LSLGSGQRLKLFHGSRIWSSQELLLRVLVLWLLLLGGVLDVGDLWFCFPASTDTTVVLAARLRRVRVLVLFQKKEMVLLIVKSGFGRVGPA
jgi:hypothetical protein